MEFPFQKVTFWGDLGWGRLSLPRFIKYNSTSKSFALWIQKDEKKDSSSHGLFIAIPCPLPQREFRFFLEDSLTKLMESDVIYRFYQFTVSWFSRPKSCGHWYTWSCEWNGKSATLLGPFRNLETFETFLRTFLSVTCQTVRTSNHSFLFLKTPHSLPVHILMRKERICMIPWYRLNEKELYHSMVSSTFRWWLWLRYQWYWVKINDYIISYHYDSQ